MNKQEKADSKALILENLILNEQRDRALDLSKKIQNLNTKILRDWKASMITNILLIILSFLSGYFIGMNLLP